VLYDTGQKGQDVRTGGLDLVMCRIAGAILNGSLWRVKRLVGRRELLGIIEATTAVQQMSCNVTRTPVKFFSHQKATNVSVLGVSAVMSAHICSANPKTPAVVVTINKTQLRYSRRRQGSSWFYVQPLQCVCQDHRP
jgi:hypothetical protein